MRIMHTYTEGPGGELAGYSSGFASPTPRLRPAMTVIKCVCVCVCVRERERVSDSSHLLSHLIVFDPFANTSIEASPLGSPAGPPAKGLDEACAWLHKAALTPFPTGH